MAVPFVQKANSGVPSGTATTKTVTLNGQTAGNLNFLVVVYGNASGTTVAQTISSVTDTKGNVYQQASGLGQFRGSGGAFNTNAIAFQAFYCPQIQGGNNTVTVTLSGAASFFLIGLYEYAISAAAPFSNASTAITKATSGNSATAMTGGNTYAYNGDLVIGFSVSLSGPSAVGAGFTQRDLISTLLVEDQQIASTGVLNATGTTVGPQGWMMMSVVFRTPQSVLGSPSTGEFLLSDAFTGSGGIPTSLQGFNNWTLWSPGTGVQFAQVNAGAQVKCSRFRFSDLTGGEDLLVGATLQGCNDPSFVFNPVTLWTGTRALSGLGANEVVINAATAYEFYRLTMPSATQTYSGLTTLDIYATWTRGIVAQPADIRLSPSTGNFDLPTYLTLSCLSSSATIYYTLDGSTPSTSSPSVSGPLLVNSTCTLQAFAVDPAQAANGRVLSRRVHIGATEVSVDDIFDSRNMRIWAMNGSTYQDPISKWWYRYGTNSDSPHYYTYGFPGDNVYRSADLRNWDFRGQICQAASGMDTTTNIANHIAPHILYNALNANYVLWADSYTGTGGSFTWIGKTVWTSSSPEGPFTQVRTLTTFPGIPTTGANDWGQGDFSLFLDTDGVSAYLVSAMGNGSTYNQTIFIAKLTTDYTNISATTQTFTLSGREAYWMIYVAGSYYLFNSGALGFSSSGYNYMKAASVMGPWAAPNTLPFQPVSGGVPDYATSYDSQGWQIITVPGRGYIYHGDRYSQTSGAFPNLKRIRLPVVFSAGTVTINWYDAWSFDAQLPSSGGGPTAASNLVVTGGSASWTNNEPYPAKIYLDMAPASGFGANTTSIALPDGATSASGVPAASLYRIRTLNASGTALSAVFGQSPVTGMSLRPVQVRFLIGADGNLYAQDEAGQSFLMQPGGAVGPPVYSPTK